MPTAYNSSHVIVGWIQKLLPIFSPSLSRRFSFHPNEYHSRLSVFIQGSLNLETAVGSQKSAKPLGAPRKIKKCLITRKVTTTFFISPGTSIASTAFLCPTAVSRLKNQPASSCPKLFRRRGRGLCNLKNLKAALAGVCISLTQIVLERQL